MEYKGEDSSMALKIAEKAYDSLSLEGLCLPQNTTKALQYVLQSMTVLSFVSSILRTTEKTCPANTMHDPQVVEASSRNIRRATSVPVEILSTSLSSSSLTVLVKILELICDFTKEPQSRLYILKSR